MVIIYMTCPTDDIVLIIQEFLCGERVSGLLHFTLKESKSYKRIEIKLYGGAQVRWTESDYTGEHLRIHQSQEIYVHEARILWRSDQSPQGKIGPGTFDLPFQFVIPRNCLGSFQGSVGAISYALHGLIKTGMLHCDHITETPIQVSRVATINLPYLLMPVRQSKKKHVGFFHFGSDIEFTVSLSRTGFCIGHNLPLTVSIVNGSSRWVKLRASIQRYCHFYAQDHSQVHDKRKLTTVITPEIAPHSEQTVNIEDLIVPMVEPSFSGSQIIEIQYVLKVTAVIPWASNSSVEIPITLGNVPFRM